MEIKYEFITSYDGYSEELDEDFYDSEVYYYDVAPTLEDVQDFFIEYMFPDSDNATDLIKEMYEQDFFYKLTQTEDFSNWLEEKYSNDDGTICYTSKDICEFFESKGITPNDSKEEAIKKLYENNYIDDLNDDSNFYEFMKDGYEQQAYENYQND